VTAALVLSGGGARGAYQVGVLRRVAELRPDIPFRILTGSSVGSINLAYVAARADGFATAVRALADLWAGLAVDHVYRTDPRTVSKIGLRWVRDLAGGGHVAGGRARGLLDTAPLEALVRRETSFSRMARMVDERIVAGLSVAATSYTTGQAVDFVQAGPDFVPWSRARRIAVPATMDAPHVLASSAIPFVFPAVRVGDAYYGDGNLRQSNPFSPAVKLGASRIFAISVRHPVTAASAARRVVHGYPPPAHVAGLLLNTIFLDNFEDDAVQLLRVNALLRSMPEAAGRIPGFRPVDLLAMAPSRDLGRLALGYQDRFPPTVRWLLRGIGAPETRSADLVSYLLFDRAYTQALLEIGYADAAARIDEIERFLSTP
jgi:NTE family protein